MRLVVGVTGAIGGGKSTLAKLLAEAFLERGLEAEILDADRVARDLVEAAPGAAELRATIARRFGEDVLRPDGMLDRTLLARRAFADDASAEALNAIVHPRVVEAFRSVIAAFRRPGSEDAALLLDVPLLFESGIDRLCDTTVAVTAPRAARLERASRFGNVEDRERRQWPEDRKADAARHVVANHGTPEELGVHARSLAENLLANHR